MGEGLHDRTLRVLTAGLDLYDRLNRGEQPELRAEQAKLKGLLGDAGEPPPWGSGGQAAGAGSFLGARYGLACWLDELFIAHGPEWWAQDWNEEKLESALFEMQMRSSEFWNQVSLAEAAPGGLGALAAYWQCVMLGFRGDKADDPRGLQDWARSVRSRLARPLGQEPPQLPELPAGSDVPLLRGRDRYRLMLRVLIFAVLLAVTAGAFLSIFLLNP